MKITLNEQALRASLAQADAYDYDIADGWEPAEPGEENTIYHLVEHAQDDTEVITYGEGVSNLTFEYSPDEDGGGYFYSVDVKVPGSDPLDELRLRTMWQEMRRIVIGGFSGGSTGIEAAVEIVTEAVDMANGELAKLVRFAAAYQPVSV